MTVHVRRSALVFGIAVAVSGCAETQLKAVSATSQMGEHLADHAAEVRAIEESCFLMRALQKGTKCPADLDRWSRALDMLVAYSRQLGRAAGDAGPDIHGEVAAALDGTARWTGLSQDADKSISKVASAVTAFVSREATRAAVQKAIRDAGPSLDIVVKGLVAHIQIERRYLLQLRCSVACDAGLAMDAAQCPETKGVECKPSADEGTALAVARASLELSREDQALDAAEKAVTAFGAAHARLYKNVDHLDKEELYKSVIEDIGAALKATGGGG